MKHLLHTSVHDILKSANESLSIKKISKIDNIKSYDEQTKTPTWSKNRDQDTHELPKYIFLFFTFKSKQDVNKLQCTSKC